MTQHMSTSSYVCTAVVPESCVKAVAAADAPVLCCLARGCMTCLRLCVCVCLLYCLLQVGYTISPSGDMQAAAAQAPPSTLAPHGSGVVNALLSLTRRHSSVSAVGSTTGMAPVPSTGGSSIKAAAAPLQGQPADGLPTAAGAAAAGDSSSMSGAMPAAAGGVHEAVPPVEGLVPNPVLANLERAFTADPRRHKRTDSQISQISQLSSKLSGMSIGGLGK